MGHSWTKNVLAAGNDTTSTKDQRDLSHVENFRRRHMVRRSSSEGLKLHDYKETVLDKFMRSEALETTRSAENIAPNENSKNVYNSHGELVNKDRTGAISNLREKRTESEDVLGLEGGRSRRISSEHSPGRSSRASPRSNHEGGSYSRQANPRLDRRHERESRGNLCGNPPSDEYINSRPYIKQCEDYDRKDLRRSSKSSLLSGHSTHSAKPYHTESGSSAHRERDRLSASREIPSSSVPPELSNMSRELSAHQEGSSSSGSRKLSNGSCDARNSTPKDATSREFADWSREMGAASRAAADESEGWESSSLSTHDSHGNVTCYRGYTQRKSITSMDPRLPDSDLNAR